MKYLDYFGKLALTWPTGYCEQQLTLGRKCDPNILKKWDGYRGLYIGIALPFMASGLIRGVLPQQGC